jgi:hypothetical protein
MACLDVAQKLHGATSEICANKRTTNMRRRFYFFLAPCVAVLLFGAASPATAQLDGSANHCEPDGRTGRVVYDANQGVCWLADANLAGDPGVQAALGVAGINPNGTMDFSTALNWVAALNSFNNGAGYLGHNDWQLPVAPLTDGTCAATGSGGGSFGPLCTGSAMGNLYYAGLNRTYPDGIAPKGFGARITPFRGMRLSYYWTSGNFNGSQEVFSFANGIQGGVTTKYTYYYALPMVPGPIGEAPSCLPGSGVVPYMNGPVAGKAVYDCLTGYTWTADANLAAQRNFGITGNATIVTDDGRAITAPLIDNGKMLFAVANQWVAAMNDNEYLGSSKWQLPASSKDLKTLFQDLNLASGDARLARTGDTGPLDNLQPFYYWGCQRDQFGNSQSPCTGYAPGQLQWTFNFDDGFQGTATLIQKFFVMVYYPAPF